MRHEKLKQKFIDDLIVLESDKKSESSSDDREEVNIMHLRPESLSPIRELSENSKSSRLNFDETVISIPECEEEQKIELFQIYDSVYRIGHLLTYLRVE